MTFMFVSNSCQLFFIALQSEFAAKIPVIDGINAVRFLFGPVFVPVFILPDQGWFAGTFVGSGDLVNGNSTFSHFNSDTSNLSYGFNKSAIGVKFIAQGEKLVKLLFAQVNANRGVVWGSISIWRSEWKKWQYA